MADVKAFELIANFARAPEPHVRRNVAAALGVLSDERAIPLLTNLALTDPDESVREAAEAELSGFKATALDGLRRDLVLRVQSADRRKALGAMALVGRLRQRGLHLKETSDNPWAALRKVITSESKLSTFRQVLVERMERYARLRPTYTLRWRAWPFGLLGAAVVAAIVAYYVHTTVGFSTTGLQGYVVSASLLGTVGVIFGTRRNIPMLFQWDPAASLIRDVTETTAWSIVVATVGCAPYLLDAGVAWWDALLLGATAGALAAIGFAAVHVGNYLATSTWRNRFVAWLWLVTIATGAGAVVHTLVLWLVRLRVDNDHEAWLAEAIWLLALPASAAIAFSLGRVDAVTSTESFAERLKSPRTRGALVMASAAMLLVVLAAGRVESSSEVGTAFTLLGEGTQGGELEPVREQLRPPVSTVRLALPFTQHVAFEASPEVAISLAQFPGMSAGASGERCPGAASALATRTDPVPSSTTRLMSAGCYVVQAQLGGTDPSFAEVLLARSPYIQAQVENDRVLVVRPNVGQAEFSESPETLDEGRATSWLTRGAQGRRLRFSTTTQSTLHVDAGVVGLVAFPGAPPAAWSIKLTTADGSPVATGAALQTALEPGDYVLEVTPASSTETVWSYARFERLIEISDSFDAVPAIFSFTQRSIGPVLAKTDQSELDLVMEIWRAADWDRNTGESVAYGDDPPEAEATLGPGSYVAVIRAYHDTARARPVALREEHRLTVVADPTGPLSRR